MRFKRIYIEITNKCNLNCSFCPSSNREERTMSLSEFNYILDQIKGQGEYIFFHIKGEPLLHPQLDALLDSCYNKNFKVNITTNGTMINALGEMLIEKPAVRLMSFSLQSIENMHNEIMQDQYIYDIIRFSKLATNKTNIMIELRLWNLISDSLSQNDLNKNNRIIEIIEAQFGIQGTILHQVNKNKGNQIVKNVYLSQNLEFEWPDINKDIISYEGYCHGLKQQVGILSDGTVIPCCLDSEGVIDLGNIFNKSFVEILEDKKTKEIIDGFANKNVVEPLCQRCGYRTRFRK